MRLYSQMELGMVVFVAIGVIKTMKGNNFDIKGIKKISTIIDFPLRGEWISPNTPGKKIPSHGTNEYGETYAYDFVKVKKGNGVYKFYNESLIRYLLFGVPLERCYGWGENIYAPCDGEIKMVVDGVKERQNVNLISDLKYMRRVTEDFKQGKVGYREVAGNYVIMKCDEGVYALFAHMKTNSIAVAIGQKIKKGQIIGKVGHSGNSTAPHLHFQMMDNENIRIAKGIPCAFESYEALIKGKWIKIVNGIPTGKEPIRK